MLKSTLNNALVIIVLVTIIVVQSMAIPAVASDGNVPNCEPTYSPRSDGDAQNVSSPDFKALMRLDGYVQYDSESYGKLYMSFEAKNLTYLTGTTGISLVAADECSTITIDFIRAETFEGLRVLEMTVELNLNDGDKKTCKSRFPLINCPGGMHYVCNGYREYGCFSEINYGLPVAKIVFESFEFEINNGWDSNAGIKNGQFSLPAHHCI